MVDAHGESIRCAWRHSDTSDRTLRAILLDHVLPLVIALRGRYVLHAAAVMNPIGVCAFIGYSGAGKSTIAAHLATTGSHLLTDDCLVLGRQGDKFVAWASQGAVKLRPDSIEFLNIAAAGEPAADYTVKQRIGASNLGAPQSRGPLPLSRLFFLERDEAATSRYRPLVEPLSGRAAFLKLIQHGVRPDPTDKAMLQREFEFARELVDTVPAAQLSLPNDFSALRFVSEAIGAGPMVD